MVHEIIIIMIIIIINNNNNNNTETHHVLVFILTKRGCLVNKMLINAFNCSL